MHPPEQWAPIEGYLGRYAVSDRGNVLSINYARTGQPALLTPVAAPNGYLSVQLSDGLKVRRSSIHRLVARAFLGPCPPGKQVNHRDGNKSNNAVENLEYVTASQNRQHAFRIGLQSLKGECHTHAKLSDARVHEIRSLIASGMTHRAIAQQVGISRSNVSMIGAGKAWAHVRTPQ